MVTLSDKVKVQPAPVPPPPQPSLATFNLNQTLTHHHQHPRETKNLKSEKNRKNIQQCSENAIRNDGDLFTSTNMAMNDAQQQNTSDHQRGLIIS
ncbi:hypothetical protein DERF_008086 [Dermatophagoides farinae]|uniref:Uncharacterized protein n=1 Tax=Dermatophagoides farinae TaxID=6954 RepID=A0A922I1P8_DERFA|nr:hypothetical protein DERF_008086 [Dermatophagoides farinae]